MFKYNDYALICTGLAKKTMRNFYMGRGITNIRYLLAQFGAWLNLKKTFMYALAAGILSAFAWVINVVWYKPFSIVMFYEKALELDPEYAAACNLLCLVELRQGNTKEALEHIQKALSLIPNDASSLASAAEVHSTLGNTRMFYKYFRQAL